ESSYGSGSGSGDGSDTEDDIEGSGYGGSSSGTGAGGPHYRPPNNNDLDNNLHPIGPGGEIERHRPKNSTSGGSSSSTKSQISVTRAVTTYLLPIVVMWFGGIFSDWL
ncbi:hypothetical protein L9F63_003107, partial [Diploptera punctata]